MEFARPYVLYGLFLVPIVAGLLAYGSRRRREELLAFVGPHYAELLAPGRSWRKGALKGVLKIGGTVLLVLGLSGPRFGSQLVKVEREGVDLVIALDVSLSMLAEDMKPNRLERAKQEIIDLIRGLRGDRVGIVAFAGDAFPICPLTVDYEAAQMLLNAIDVDVVSEPGTAIGRAIRKSVALFENSSRKDKAIILVTDGESHEGDPVKEAASARGKSVRIFTIGIGNPVGELIPMRGTDGSIQGYKKDRKGETVLTRLDEPTLQRVSEASGGKYLPATREGLELKVLHGEISGMERKKIKGEFIERKKERFFAFLLASFLFLALDTVITTKGSTRRLDKRKILHTGAAGVILLLVLSFPNASQSRGINRSKVSSGNAYYEAGEYEKASVLYREALGDSVSIPSNSQGVFYNLGNSFYMMGNYQEALSRYQKSYDSSDSTLTGSMLYNRGNALLKMGRFEDAVASYVQALHFLPDDEDVRYNLELALRSSREAKQGQRNQERRREGQRERNEERSEAGKKAEEGRRAEQDGGSRSEAAPDSSRLMAQAEQDSSGGGEDQHHLQQSGSLSREDAIRILQAIEEQEKYLQKQKRKAAFKKIKKSGKDW